MKKNIIVKFDIKIKNQKYEVLNVDLLVKKVIVFLYLILSININRYFLFYFFVF